VTVSCVIAQSVEVVSESIVPRNFTIVREDVIALVLVLELERELEHRGVFHFLSRGWRVVGHRRHTSICLNFFGSPEGWPCHGGGVRAIVGFEELSL